MIIKQGDKRRDGGGSFHTLGDYLTKEVDADTGEVLSRGEVMLSDNILSIGTAYAEMNAVASDNIRHKSSPVSHYIISWPSDEKPTREQWQEAVKHVLESQRDERRGLSLADNQYMAVAHNDTDDFHVHIMVNRINPETYEAITPDMSRKSLAKAAREIEAAQGWKHTNGLYKWDAEKGIAVETTKEERESKKSSSQDKEQERSTKATGKAAHMEAHGNAESLETYSKGQPAKDLSLLMKRDGINWQDVHSALAKHGLELHKAEKGGYTVSGKGADGERIHVKASKVFRRQFAGKNERVATDAKLGPWEAPKEFLQHVVKKEKEYNQYREPRRNPHERAERLEERAKMREDLKARFNAYKAQHWKEKRIQQNTDKGADKSKFQEISRVARELRADIQASKVAPEVRKALLSVAAAETVQEREKLRAELAEKRQQNKPKDYKTWVTEQAKDGDLAAIKQIRGWHYQEGRNAKENERRLAELDKRDNARATDNDRHDPADPRIFADAKKSAALRMTWEVNTKTGDVAYQIDGKPAFIDQGEQVSFGKDTNADSMEAGLKLAAQKYGGTVYLNGSDDFKKQAVEVAAQRGVNVKFANKELSIYHEAYKQQLQAEKEMQQRSQQEHTPERGGSNKDHDFGSR
jgi:hypothetical protein